MLSEINVGIYNALKLYPTTWTVNTVYTVGDLVKPTTYAGYSYLCTVAGTSHATTEPTWSTTLGATQTDSTVTWKVFNSKTYQVKAPQGSTVPYVTFGLLTESPVGTFADFEAVENLTYWVNVFSDKSPADIAKKADGIMDALDGATLTVTGYTGMKCVREFISGLIWDAETQIYQFSLRYRIWLDKS